MNMRRLLLPMLFLLPGLLEVGRAQAPKPISHRRWEFSAFGGTSMVEDQTFATTVVDGEQRFSVPVGVQYSSSWLIGSRLSESRGDYWGAEFEYSYANQPLRFTNLTPDLPALSLHQGVNTFAYNFIFFFTNPYRRLRPYAIAGIGTSLFHTYGSSKSEAEAAGVHFGNSWTFVFDWGGGVKYLFRDHWAARFDFRSHLGTMPDYDLPASAVISQGQYIPGLAASGTLQNWHVTAGIAYQWDGW
jgi:opacity protein-like surface antigen